MTISIRKGLNDRSQIAKIDELTKHRLQAEGSVSRSRHDKDAEIVSIKDFGASPDLSDCGGYINAAIRGLPASGGGIYIPEGVFLIKTKITVDRPVFIYGVGRRSVLRAADRLDDYIIETEAGLSFFSADGFAIEGNREGQTISGGGLRITYADNANVSNMWFSNAFNDNLYIDYTTFVRVINNHSENAGADCYTIHFSYDTIVANNTGTRSGQRAGTVGGGGVLTLVGTQGRNLISNNVFTEANYGGLTYAGGGNAGNAIGLFDSSYSIVEGNICRGGTANGIQASGGSGKHIISNNQAFENDLRGIYALNIETIVSNNRATDNGTHGITVTTPSGGGEPTRNLIQGNICSNNGTAGAVGNGIEVYADDPILSANLCNFNLGNGILLNGVQNGTVTGNSCRNNNSGSASNYSGIRLVNSTYINVTGNNCYDTLGVPTQDYGISENAGGSCNFNVYAGNIIRNAITAPYYFEGALNTIENNYTDESTTVASASTITLPRNASFVTISGTTNIDTITADRAGKEVTLLFQGVLTVTDGSNLRLAGNFVTSGNDTLTLKSGGANWFEVSRSAN